ncbi:MAG: RNA polymerase sigma factor, partial [Calditrichota bacterium]
MKQAEQPLEELLQRGFRYAFSLTHNRMDAEELVQEACYSISRLGGPWNLPYFFKSIRNRYIDVGRRRNLLQFEELIDEAYVESDATEELSDISFDDRMEEALQVLADGERELLFLSIVEGYTAQELSDLTGSPRGTILSRLHRIKSRLRYILGSNEPGKTE